MNKERDTVDWETALSFIAKKITAVRKEYLKRDLEDCQECEDKPAQFEGRNRGDGGGTKGAGSLHGVGND